MSNPIDSLLENNPSEFKESVYDALFEKLANRLELEKVNIAQSMFGIQEEQEFEGEDEEFDAEDELNEDEEFEDEDEFDFEDQEGDFSDEDE